MAEPTDADYLLGAQHLDAELRVRTLAYQIRQAYREHVEPLEKQLHEARMRLASLNEQYLAMMERLDEDDDEDEI